jgi:hypothetical protein
VSNKKFSLKPLQRIKSFGCLSWLIFVYAPGRHISREIFDDLEAPLPDGAAKQH